MYVLTCSMYHRFFYSTSVWSFSRLQLDCTLFLHLHRLKGQHSSSDFIVSLLQLFNFCVYQSLIRQCLEENTIFIYVPYVLRFAYLDQHTNLLHPCIICFLGYIFRLILNYFLSDTIHQLSVFQPSIGILKVFEVINQHPFKHNEPLGYIMK